MIDGEKYDPQWWLGVDLVRTSHLAIGGSYHALVRPASEGKVLKADYFKLNRSLYVQVLSPDRKLLVNFF